MDKGHRALETMVGGTGTVEVGYRDWDQRTWKFREIR